MKTLKIVTLVLLCSSFFSCNPEEETLPNIDLKAEFIIFSVSPTTQFQGFVTITGNIKNIGDDYRSGEGQQIISLYEKALGTPTTQTGNLVASLNFTDLNADEILEVSYTRTWNTSSPAEGEFPPEYILRIDYDPDLLIDGNDNNNDANRTNDEILVSGSLINTLF